MNKVLVKLSCIYIFYIRGSARKKEFLVKVGITHVLNTAAGIGFGQVNTGPEFYADCGIRYLGLDLIDAPRTRIIDYFDQGVNFMDECLRNNGEESSLSFI